MVCTVQIQCREIGKLLTDGQLPIYFLAESIPQFIYIKLCHWANKHGKYADRFYTFMIDHKDGHIPLPLIIFTCTALRHPIVESQRNKRVHPTDCKLKVTAERSDHSN
jgi:hypothetical protein